MIQAVVFDFDGVIANSEPLHFRAFRDVLAEESIPLSESAYYAKYLGFDDAGAFEAIAADTGRAWQPGDLARLIERKALIMEELERDASVLFPGAREAIGRMADLGPIAIASGALRVEIERVLVREQLRNRFPVLVSAEDTPLSKPDPAPYRLAVEQLAAGCGVPLQPGDCVAIEDSRWGLVSAREAGLRTIGITHSYGPQQLAEADRVITHLDMLTVDLLRTL